MWQLRQRLEFRLVKRLVIIGGIYFLSACATLSKQECMIGDWQAIGYNDGVAGYAADRLASHTKACSKVSITPDYQLWERGRQLGLKQYCTVTSAYNIGRRGQKLNNVCPITLANSLQVANQKGLDYYSLYTQLDKDKRLLETTEIEFKKLKNGEMLDFETEKEARARLLSLPIELRDIESRIYNIQKKLALLNQMNSD